jgi:hypothetical protein
MSIVGIADGQGSCAVDQEIPYTLGLLLGNRGRYEGLREFRRIAAER